MGEFRLEQHSLRLQSLRGIAAFCVAVGHGLTVMAAGRIENPEFALRPENSLLAAGELLFQPNTAVILFYVLSGFVLGETLRRRTASTETRHLMAFGIRRLWRLLPVMWLSIIFAAAIVVTFPRGPFEDAWIWFNRLLEISVTPWTLLTNLLGLSHEINSVLWSIQIELVMIALLPAMAALSARLTLLGDFLVVLFLCGLSLKAWNVLPFFVYCFYLGVMLPKLVSNGDCARFLGNAYGLAFSLSLLIPIDLLYDLNRLWMPYKFVADALISTHLIAFLMLRPDCRHARFLDHPVLTWVGNISYSFYCYAMTVLVAVASLLLTLIPPGALGRDARANLIGLGATLACVAIALVLAQLSYRFVERPSMAIGRAMSKRIEAGASLLRLRTSVG